MASVAYTSGVREMLAQNIDYLTDTIKLMLVGTATPYTPNVDDDFVDAGGANDPVDAEINVTGYAPGWGGAGRKTLASKTITVDDSNNRVTMDAADATFTALGAGATIAAGIVIKEGGANDTTSQMITYQDVTDTATNGGDIVIQFATNGFMFFNCS